MSDYRIATHPILPIPERETIEFTWQGQKLQAQAGETIATALFANGIRTFGYHPKDGSPQGIFCANGQCAQCTVIADGLPLKSCMALVQPGMAVEPVTALPKLPDAPPVSGFKPTETFTGGLPDHRRRTRGTCRRRLNSVSAESRPWWWTTSTVSAGSWFCKPTASSVRSTPATPARAASTSPPNWRTMWRKFPAVTTWLNSTAIAVFSDKKVGVVRDGKDYVLIEPKTILVATGAREKSLTFKGNTLPGVYGAGAFQTLVNRDLVRCSERLFIIGGGNVGLIAGYHALQAGIEVAGLVEALPECGGYKVHKDKLVRMGVPIYTSHTILSANGTDSVESVTIAAIDKDWKPIPGTEQTFACDTLLVAVGLDPVDEFYKKAQEFGLSGVCRR